MTGPYQGDMRVVGGGQTAGAPSRHARPRRAARSSRRDRGRPLREDAPRPGGGPSGGPASDPAAGGRSPARMAGTLVVVAAIAAVGGLGFQRVFGLAGLIPVLAVGATVPVVLAGLISWPRRRPWPLWVSIVATVVCWTLIVGLSLFHGDFAVIGGSLRDSWKATLTTLLPAPATARLLVLPYALVWFAAFTGAELSLRTSTGALPAMPSAAVFGVALLLGVGGPGSSLPIAALLVGLVALLATVRGGGRPTRLLTSVPVAVALGLVGALAAPHLPKEAEPYDPRTAVKAPPPQQRDSVSPLDRVSAWLQNPDQQMFTVRAGTPENWRLAVLDHFDGVTWTSGAQFLAAGGRIPPIDHARRSQVVQRFAIQGLPGVWVPAADRPLTVRGLNVTVDPRSGVLTSAGRFGSGQTYTVTSAVRDYDPNELADAQPARDAEARAALALPESPGTTARNAQVPQFRRLAQQVTQDQGTAFQRASRLADYLRGTARYDVTGLPGHTYAQLSFFLFRAKRGTSEQFATAYAVLARSIGLPTRVVVGFRPGIGSGGIWQVRSGDVLVWPEVDFAGLGWVPFFPTPDQAVRSQRGQSVPTGDTQRKLQAAQKDAAAKRNNGGKAPAAPSPPPPHPARRPPAARTMPWWWYATPVAAVLLLYVLAVLVVPVLRRHRRRRATTPAARVAGAWEQTLEALRGVGLPRQEVLTAHEVAGFGARRVSGSEKHLRPLAELVNRAEYAAAPTDPAVADAAWRHTDAVNRLARRASGPVRRLGRRLHPRSLRLR